MGIVVCTYVITYNINVNLVRLWTFKIIKMRIVRLNIENYLAEKYNIKMDIAICIGSDGHTMFQAEWEENPNKDYGVREFMEYDNIRDAIYWLEMEVGARISDILKSEIDKCKEAAYQLSVLDVDGFLI
jgi:hypothetical protein